MDHSPAVYRWPEEMLRISIYAEDVLERWSWVQLLRLLRAITVGAFLRVAIASYRPVGTMPTGSRRILLDLATGLVERGFRVAIYNISRRGAGCPEALDPGVECVEMGEDLLRRSLLLPTRILTAASREGLLFTKFLVQPWVDRVSRVYYEIAEDIASRGCDVAILETIYTGFLSPLPGYMGFPPRSGSTMSRPSMSHR